MDLRTFISQLSRHGLLERVRQPVDWQYELGQMTRDSAAPLLFENIKNYPTGRVFTNGLSNISAISLALGLDPGMPRPDVVREAARRVGNPIQPVLVDAAPVLENVVEGAKVDFLSLPVPQWSYHEVGRYLGTWHVNITRDPETCSRNLGIYRMQVLGPRHATLSASPRSHLARHFATAERQDRPLEMAVAIGVSETLMMAAAAAYPVGRDEYDLAGGLQREPVKLIRCATVDLEAPAEAELVIEGRLIPGKRVQDGPYFDYTGTPNTNHSAFLFEATRMVYRNDLIFRGAAIGTPGSEDLQLFSFLSELKLFDFHGSRMRHRVQDQLVKHGCFRGFQWAGRMNVRSGIRQARKRFARTFGMPRTKQSRPIRISQIGDPPPLP
jgi:2,5-furandicarboxylate decarboxylase 1